MQCNSMHLKILLPSHIFADKTGVKRIVAETREGSISASSANQPVSAGSATP